MRRLATSAFLLLVAASLAAGALASRKPDHDEALAIARAFKITPLAGLNKIAYQFDVVKIRVSTVNPHFARGNFVPKPKYRKRFQAGYGVARLVEGGINSGDRWRAIDVGSANVGCLKAVPRAVRGDLKLVCH